MQKFRLFEYSNNGASIDIDEQEFQRLKTWHKNVVALTEVELLFSAVARTAFEFERFLLTSALEKVFERESFDTLSGAKFHFNELTSAANIHLLTFLSAVRAYHDQRSSILSSSCFPREVVVEISKVFSAAFDESFDYRLMEALRNYAQHNRLPISAVTWETNFETPPNAKK